MRKWQKCEEYILTKLEEQFPDSEILSNQKMPGRYSKTKRQVDVLLRGKLAKWDMLGVVECKCFSKKINVKSVDQFIGMVNDIGGHVGVMFTNVGYSRSAADAEKRVFSGEYQLAFLLNPTRIEQVQAIAGAREKMPPKSTYFYPKLLSGLVINPFE